MIRRVLGGAALAATGFVVPLACSEFEEAAPAQPAEAGPLDGSPSNDAGVDRELPPVVPPIVVTATSSAPRVLVGESVDVTITVKRDGDEGFKGPVHIEMAALADVAATGLDIPAEASNGKTTVVFTAKRKHGRLPLIFKATSAGSPSTGEARVSVVARGPAGSLDNGFGTDGVFSLGPAAKGTGVALVAGNKILLGGSIANQAAVVRLNEDGTPDTSYGTMGRFTKGFTSFESTGDITIDSANNAFLAVTADVGFGQNALVMKLSPTGALATDYGTQGVARTSGYRALGIAWTSKGVFVGGKDNGGNSLGFVAQLLPDGSGLLPSWGYRTAGDGSGSCKTDSLSLCHVHVISVGANELPFFASANGNNGCDVTAGNTLLSTSSSMRVEACRSVGTDGQGRIYVAGLGNEFGTGRVFRYLSDGFDDDTWGASEQLMSGEGGSGPKPSWEGVLVQRALVQADGTVVAAGSPNVAGKTVFGAYRLKANGERDTSFAPDGTVYKTIGSGNATLRSMVVDGEGRIVLVGSTDQMVAVRFWQ